MSAPEEGLRTMLGLIAELPAQLAGAGVLPGLDALRPAATCPREVLFCGMGGSAAAADLLAPLVAVGGLRLSVWRDYGLPGWAGPEHHVVLSSYSGDTEETLSAAAAAVARGCSLTALTSGGALRDLAAGTAGGEGFPCVVLPAGLPPRAALGHGVGVLLHVLHRLGLAPDPAPAVAAAVAVLREGEALFGPGADPDGNAALALARRLLGRMAVIHSASPEAHPAARRLKAQINENAKSPACVAELPELDHNEIVGWETLRRRRDDFLLVQFRSGDETPVLARRAEVTAQLLAGEFHAVETVTARGDVPLARVLSLVQFGDYLSCYLASAAGVDPMPVARIKELKALLKEGPPA